MLYHQFNHLVGGCLGGGILLSKPNAICLISSVPDYEYRHILLFGHLVVS